MPHILSWEMGLGNSEWERDLGMSSNDRVCGICYLLKADSLALCCRKYSYTSSFDKSDREWFLVFVRTLNEFISSW